MPSRLVLWGASGHGKVILDIAEAMGVFDEIVFIDDALKHEGQFCGRRALPGSTYFIGITTGDQFLISIGRNETRAARFQDALNRSLNPATLIHPSAVISPSARLGPGTVVMPRVVVNAAAQIGSNCILNSGAVIEHDCRIGDHVHLSPGVLLAGGVTVHPFAHLGIGAVALPGAEIGEGAVVGAGAVVVRSIPPGVTVAGVPAKPLVQR